MPSLDKENLGVNNGLCWIGVVPGGTLIALARMGFLHAGRLSEMQIAQRPNVEETLAETTAA
jgi:hypothetical protein